jgi:lauroyl/myristoyl acyltransferase
VLVALLGPPAFARAAVDVWVRGLRPPTQLPPLPGTTTRAHRALYDRLLFRMTPLAGFWIDRLAAPEWSGRYDVSEIERLRSELAGRPLILVSFHYGALVMVPPVLTQYGVPTALAVSREGWPLSRLRQWRLDLARIDDTPTVVPAEARAMLRFLRPGRCLIVAVDYPTAERAAVPYNGSLVRLSTPPLRLARAARAVVVPMLALHQGPWRMSMRLGRPVPDELIARADYDAAAAHIVSELLPLAAAAPRQALPTLVEAFEPEAYVAGASEGVASA